MKLTSGMRLGPYEIVAPIGAGGMGEVYRARDIRLDRTVAIKALPEHVAGDPNHRQRFEREARVISSLNHPSICTLHDIGHQDGVDFLVMEYVDGETLAHRLEKGLLPLDQVLDCGIQIADALDKAHRQGVVHRDLKPANIMLTKAGVKLLDFGLAKLRDDRAAVVDGVTRSAPLTGQGTILGTLQYMAPEQLECKEADARTDIFAFGAVLYEMATGKKAFEGTSQASLIAAILERDPTPAATLQPTVPPMLDRVTRQCLAKNPDKRWQSAQDLASELKWIAESIGEVEASAASRPRTASTRMTRVVFGLFLGAIVTAGIALWTIARPPPVADRIVRAVIPLAAGDVVAEPAWRSPLAVAPDGSKVVFSGFRAGKRLLFARTIDGNEASPIPGTDGGDGPFFSPDGRWVGFFASGQVKKVSLSGGAPQTIAPVRDMRGGAWTADNFIIVAPSMNIGLARVSAAGGSLETLTVPNRDQREKSHRWPQVLPGGKAVLFTIGPNDVMSFDDARIGVLALETKQWKVLLRGGMYARYAPTGHIVYAQAGSLLAVPFDLNRLEVDGQPVAVVEHVAMSQLFGTAAFDFSTNGSLVYSPAPKNQRRSRVLLVDRRGKTDMLLDTTEVLEGLSASPDGARLALWIGGANDSVHAYDVGRKTTTRLSFGPGDAMQPIWTPDGTQITFATTDPNGLTSVTADGSGQERRLITGEYIVTDPAWSPDGRHIAFVQSDPQTQNDIWTLSRGDPKPTPFLKTPYVEEKPRFSPDGRWLAYSSNESGRFEVYVRPFPGPGGKWQVSTDGGGAPRWSRGGRELLYRMGTRVMAVSAEMVPVFKTGHPRVVVDGPYDEYFGGPYDYYDVMPDGRLVMIQPEQGEPTAQLNLVLDWFVALKSGVAGR